MCAAEHNRLVGWPEPTAERSAAERCWDRV
jgi:hypothetical protein